MSTLSMTSVSCVAHAVAIAVVGCAQPAPQETPRVRESNAPAHASAPVVSAQPMATVVPSATASSAPAPPSPCPKDMVAVEGAYCTRYQLKCLRPRKPWQCAEYEKPGVCKGPEVEKRFCIDRYEFPNQKGATATVMNSWMSARHQCRDIGKRLCTDSEWTMACEGPERLAFPYGYVRDSDACPIDKKSPKVNEKRLFWKQTQDEEVARLDQREPSGNRQRCVSGYGVHDLTGNVDEWVVNETGRPYRSSLKGGNWGEYRNACRPTTRGHDEGFYYYQTGFRCCLDMPESALE